jgi:hypothetical protein
MIEFSCLSQVSWKVETTFRDQSRSSRNQLLFFFLVVVIIRVSTIHLYLITEHTHYNRRPRIGKMKSGMNSLEKYVRLNRMKRIFSNGILQWLDLKDHLTKVVRFTLH